MDTSDTSDTSQGPSEAPTSPPPERSAAPVPPSTRQMPMAIGAALILSLVSSIVITACIQYTLAQRERYGGDLLDVVMRWSAIGAGLGVAWLTLAAAGAAELVRRTSDRAKLGARMMLVGLLAVAAVSFFYYYWYYRLEASSSFERMQDLQRWTRQIRATAWHPVTIGALLAGWREPRIRLLAAPLVIASLLAEPYDFYGEPLYRLFEDSWLRIVQSFALDAVYLGLLVVVLRRGAPLVEASGGWARASAALDRTASALYARLWISAASVTLIMISFGNRDSAGLAKMWMLGVPLGVAVANLVAVSGIFAAGGLTVPKAPRRLLYLAGTLLMMATFLSAMQMFRLFHNWPDVGDAAKMLPLELPVIGALALCALAEALDRLSSLLPSLEVMQRASTSKLIVILSQLAVVGVQYYMTSSPPSEPGSFVLILMISVGASIAALVSQARLCRALAAQIRERNELPAATIITS